MAEPNTSLGAKERTGPNVDFIRVEVTLLQPIYNLIKDCLSGSRAIKKKETEYLPQPNAEDKSEENKSRYASYLQRAVFYNVTKRTVSGLVGQIFLREPVVEIPPQMDILKSDFNGGGVTLNQTALMCCFMDLSYGRVGVLIDYPDTEIPASALDIQTGKVRPAVITYDAWEIINWRTKVLNGKEIFTLVVIHESIVANDDGFEQEMKEQWRVLSLDVSGLYVVELYENTEVGFTITNTYFPKDAKGKRLTEIPFTFIGVYNNNAIPDDPPMYDMAELNVAHYRNSADYEEAAFICGQPTPVISGLTEDWAKNVLKGVVTLGSRAAVMLPINGKAELLQAEENGMPKEAMEIKERQMVALGAKLVQQAVVQRTATEAGFENTSEISILANIANNVSIAMKFALVWCARFMGVDETNINYQLNKEFDLTQLDPQMLQEVVAAWQSGALSFSEMRATVRRAGFATLDDKGAQAAFAEDKANGVAPIQPPKPGNNPAAPQPQGPQP